jgi:hypothetical protein
MNRITKLQKQIAENHIAAKLGKRTFDEAPQTREEVINGLKAGKLYKGVLDEIEFRYVSMTSTMIMAVLAADTKAYRDGVHKGFKVLLTNLGIA